MNIWPLRRRRTHEHLWDRSDGPGVVGGGIRREFKAAVIEECLKSGVSIGAVALAHSRNANLLRKWVIDAEHMAIPPPVNAPAEPEPPAMPPPTFIPLALPAPTADGEIRIELQRAGKVIKFVWPAAAVRDCAAWLRDWLR